MPAKSAKQQRFMAMLSHNPEMAKAKGIPVSVAEEFAHKPAGGYKKTHREMAHDLQRAKPK